MKSFSIGRINILVLLGALLMLFGGFLYLESIAAVASFAAVLLGIVVSVVLSLEKTFSFYLVLILFIPLSIDIGLFGDAQINVPSELMLLLLIAVLILFHPEYPQSLIQSFSHPIGILLIVDLLWQLITTLTSSHMDVSFKRFAIHAIFTLGFFTTQALLNDPKRILKSWLAYVIGLLPVMWHSYNTFRIQDFNPRTVFSISKPFFADHTIYGACIAFILPLLFVLCLNWRKLSWKNWQIIGLFVITLIAFASELITLSRAALLSIVVALLFAIFLHWKMNFRSLIIGLIGLAIVAFSFQSEIYSYIEKNDAVSNDGQVTNHLSSVTNIQTDASNLERINRWVCAIRMFEDRPWLGYGPGTYQFEYNAFQTLEYKTYISSNVGDKGNAHSEYLTHLSEKGVLGGIVFLLIVFSAIYFGMQNHLELKDPFLRMLNLGILLGLVTYFFHGIFNSFLDQSKMAFLYFSALGAIVWLNQRKKVQTAL